MKVDTRDKDHLAVPLRTRIALCLSVASLAVASRPAVAAPADEAEAMVRKGIELRKDFKDQEALDQFQRAYQLVREPRTMAQIGVAEQALGRWVDAEVHVAEALTTPRDPWISKNREALDQALAVIRSHLGDLEIITSPTNADVRVDGREVGRTPFRAPLRARAGSVIVEVRAPGYHPVTRSVAVAADELTRETVSLQKSSGTRAVALEQSSEPVAPESGAPRSEDADRENWRRPLAWALAGGAVVFAGGGIVGLVVRNDKAKSYNRLIDLNGCTGESAMACNGLRSDGNLAGTLALVGFGVAGALAIGSAVLFVTAPAAQAGTAVALDGCGVNVVRPSLACRLSF